MDRWQVNLVQLKGRPIDGKKYLERKLDLKIRTFYL